MTPESEGEMTCGATLELSKSKFKKVSLSVCLFIWLLGWLVGLIFSF